MRRLVTKGQLISKCLSVIVWTKYQQNYCWISALKFFEPFCGLPGSFLGSCPGDLIFNIINKEAPRKVQKISGQKSRNHFVGILEETIIS